MSFKKYQIYYVKSLFSNNDISSTANIIMQFKNKFNIDLKLNSNDIAQIKHKIVGNLNNLDIEHLLKEIKLEPNLGLEVNSTDIKYTININNKDIDRAEKIIVISTNLMRENFKK